MMTAVPIAHAQRTVPINKESIELINSCLVVNRFIKNAVIGTRTPFMSINPVDSHCTVAAETSNTSIKLLIATFNALSERSVLPQACEGQ